MRRMEDTELGGHASRFARAYFGDSLKLHDIVRSSILLNSYVAGFWAGARHAEKYGGNEDPRPAWRKVLFVWENWPTVQGLADIMSATYLRSFPSISRTEGEVVRSAAHIGFVRGHGFRVDTALVDQTFRPEGELDRPPEFSGPPL